MGPPLIASHFYLCVSLYKLNSLNLKKNEREKIKTKLMEKAKKRKNGLMCVGTMGAAIAKSIRPRHARRQTKHVQTRILSLFIYRH